MKSSSSDDQPDPSANGGGSSRKKWSFHYTGEAPQSADWLVLAVVAGLAIAAAVIIPNAERKGAQTNDESAPPAKATKANVATNLSAIAANHEQALKAGN